MTIGVVKIETIGYNMLKDFAEIAKIDYLCS